MPLPVFNTQKLDPHAQSREIGVFGSRGGYLIPDQDLDEAFMYVHVGVGGDLVMKGLDDQPIPFFKVTSGSSLGGLFKGVFSSATVPGYGFMETNASQLTWHGGNGISDP